MSIQAETVRTGAVERGVQQFVNGKLEKEKEVRLFSFFLTLSCFLCQDGFSGGFIGWN